MGRCRSGHLGPRDLGRDLAFDLAINTISLFAFGIPAGIVPTTFAPVVEGDFVTANLEMPDGTPAERTNEVAMELERAGRRVIERLDRDRPRGSPSLLSGVSVTVGQRARVEGGGLDPTPTLNPQPNIATIEFKLLSAQHRDLSTIAIVQDWREEVGILLVLVPALMAVYLRANSRRFGAQGVATATG